MMDLMDLAIQIRIKEHVIPSLALSWAWRIMDEYPEPLRDSIIAWAAGEPVPDCEIYGYTLSELVADTGSSILSAADLMYVLYKDRNQGAFLISRCAKR